MTFSWRRLYTFTAALALAGAAPGAPAAQLPLITPDVAYREVRRGGFLRGVGIAGDFDLSRLQPPAGTARIVLQNIHINGRVHASGDGPPIPVTIDGSELQRLELSGARLRAGLALDNSTVQGAARFDDGQFDGPFVLHASVFASGAVFRRTRFGGAVEIVATRFEKQTGMSGGVSFSDARFAAPARFDRSRFATDVRFDTSRFEADATFLGLVVPGHASWRNVVFSRDAEFRFCRLGDADFGDAEQMTVFAGLADFRGCALRSARFDYVDARGDVMFVNVTVAPGDLTLRYAALRGGRSDFSGLKVAGRIDLEGAYISALHFRWDELVQPLTRARPRSDVLRPLYQRLNALQQNEEARDVWAMLEEQLFHERLASPNSAAVEKALSWLEWLFWGWPTGYGTRLGRIAALTLAAWLILSLPLLLWPGLQLGCWESSLTEAPSRHRPAPPNALKIAHAAALDRKAQLLAYSFGLMFATPGLRLRPADPLPPGAQLHLTLMRGAGALLLALLALTLANVSPVFQAVLGKVVG